jgi:hypothetical protein
LDVIDHLVLCHWLSNTSTWKPSAKLTAHGDLKIETSPTAQPNLLLPWPRSLICWTLSVDACQPTRGGCNETSHVAGRGSLGIQVADRRTSLPRHQIERPGLPGRAPKQEQQSIYPRIYINERSPSCATSYDTSCNLGSRRACSIVAWVTALQHGRLAAQRHP